MITHIFFDRDGTLSQQYRYSDTFFHCCEILHCRPEEVLIPMMTNVFFTIEEASFFIGKNLNKKPEEIQSALINSGYWLAILSEFQSLKPFSDTVKTLTTLKKMGYTLCLLSDAIPQFAKPTTSEEEYFNLLDHLFFSCNLGCTKSSTEIYHKVANLLNIDLGSVIMIGDKMNRDVLPALNAGCANALLLKHENIINTPMYSHVNNNVTYLNTIDNLLGILEKLH